MIDRQGWIGDVPRFEQTGFDAKGKPIFRHRRLKSERRPTNGCAYPKPGQPGSEARRAWLASRRRDQVQ